MGWDIDNSEDCEGSSDTFQARYFSFLGFAQRYREQLHVTEAAALGVLAPGGGPFARWADLPPGRLG
jgi:hypothetical protein